MHMHMWAREKWPPGRGLESVMYRSDRHVFKKDDTTACIVIQAETKAESWGLGGGRYLAIHDQDTRRYNRARHSHKEIDTAEYMSKVNDTCKNTKLGGYPDQVRGESHPHPAGWVSAVCCRCPALTRGCGAGAGLSPSAETAGSLLVVARAMCSTGKGIMLGICVFDAHQTQSCTGNK